jgi:hypothetical protein
VAGAILLGVCAAGLPARETVGALVAVGAASGAGLLDDWVGETRIKGLRGHLRALTRGEVTTGIAKILLIGAGALAGAAVAASAPAHKSGTRRSEAPWRAGAEIGLDAAVIALAAHVFNLLDLRPGRALKAVAPPAAALAAARGPAAPVAAAALGAAVAAAPADLAERTMLGDCGAAGLGAALGVAGARHLSANAKVGVVAFLLAVTAASERVSFSEVIARHPALARLDAWGRRP